MIGLFILDVSGSTAQANTSDISDYLKSLEQHVSTWTESLESSYVNFRMGDELFFACDSPSSMLVLAYYIKLLWPYKNQPIKFGMAIENIDFPEGDLDHWNAPVIKSARKALEEIKLSDITDFKLELPKHHMAGFSDVLFCYFTDIINEQTKLQKEVFTSNLITPSQKELAEVLGKSVSTISTHLKRGRSRQLLLIKDALKNYDDTFSDAMEQKILETLQRGDIRWQ